MGINLAHFLIHELGSFHDAARLRVVRVGRRRIGDPTGLGLFQEPVEPVHLLPKTLNALEQLGIFTLSLLVIGQRPLRCPLGIGGQLFVGQIASRQRVTNSLADFLSGLVFFLRFFKVLAGPFPTALVLDKQQVLPETTLLISLFDKILNPRINALAVRIGIGMPLLRQGESGFFGGQPQLQGGSDQAVILRRRVLRTVAVQHDQKMNFRRPRIGGIFQGQSQVSGLFQIIALVFDHSPQQQLAYLHAQQLLLRFRGYFLGFLNVFPDASPVGLIVFRPEVVEWLEEPVGLIPAGAGRGRHGQRILTRCQLQSPRSLQPLLQLAQFTR